MREHIPEMEKISDDPRVQAHYELCRRNGTSHKLAEMFATRLTPGLMTDSVFLEGHCNGNQFEKMPAMGHYYREVANAKGQDTTGKVYMTSLARYPGDPEAWVAGRGDVQRVAEKYGYNVEGAVNVKALRVKPIKEVDVADDILEAEVAKVLDNHPEPQTVQRAELKESIRQKRRKKR